ncbi:Tetratricopeptide repeat-containing protein [Lentzea albidocapillata subsp. violacea]|uniref:Tetratricopeptide repeat-containing protein n=1 Tax=Lentzea albidocapillata subsp. violacea TaxID=128104 RepID=A0A1G9XSR1_9PSEU|nr:tetratricopeptide repeat protein [Lentzea albidocapillata]SDM99808.1 Tetratricopeptide repeat-containing protein [Lentzea albidocapillata subsp. violacea]
MAIFRGLATRQPGEHLAGLADALYNLGIDLLHNGQADEALDAYDESAGIYRKLAEPRPEEFEPELAAALVGKANALSGLDDDESALDLATEAVGMLRSAVRSESLELKEKLADALHTASGVAYCLGHFHRATKDGVEAVELYRSVIAEGRGDLDGVFTPILRNAVRSAVGDKRYDVALPLTKEVIGLLEEKVREGDVDVDELDDLAVDCFNAAAYAAHLGDFNEAAQLASKAVELRRTLLNTKFESVAELAEALTHHANMWSNAGHHSRAVAPAEEAVRLLAAFTDEERCPYLVSALVAQACATAVTDRVAAIGLLDEAMDVAGGDEALQVEAEEGRIEAGVGS